MHSDIPPQFAFAKLVVRDLQNEARFYRSVFGYGEGQFIRGAVAGRPLEEIIFMGPGNKVELMLMTFLDGSMPSPSGIIVGFYTRDIEAFEARVIAAGGRIMQPIGPLEGGSRQLRLAFYADPEGYLLEVLER